MHRAYLKARMDDLRAPDRRGDSRAAREERSAILGALVDLGLPENVYVRDPSRPRSALYLYRADDGRHELGAAPWRLARHAPAGMSPQDVRRVGRELRSGLVTPAIAAVVALAVALCLHLLAPAAPVSPNDLSPTAYLQVAPFLLCCVAVLLGFAALWHAWALLFPRAALVDDAESRAALGELLADRAAGEARAAGPHQDSERPRAEADREENAW